MQTSDIIASFALVIALISLGLSYRAASLSRLVAAAEKRTQAHSILVGVLLEAEELLYLVRVGINHKGDEFVVPEGLDRIEAKLSETVAKIPGRLAWLRQKTSDDPIVLEEYKAYALEVESRVKQIAPMVRELRLTAARIE